MQGITCSECEHWHEAQELKEQNAANDGNETVTPGFCYARPPKVTVVNIPNALGHIQTGVQGLRPPVNNNEHACGVFEPRDAPDLEALQ